MGSFCRALLLQGKFLSFFRQYKRHNAIAGFLLALYIFIKEYL